MFSFAPSLDPARAASRLATLLHPDLNRASFESSIRRLRTMFAAYVASCPPPWPAPGLIVTPELHYTSELWLPLDEIRPVFERLYRAALSFAPVLSSTPFAGSASWAGLVSAMPPFLSACADPALLLERLLAQPILRRRFLFWSFMPPRFYGAVADSYPAQSLFLQQVLCCEGATVGKQLRLLDAACGDGVGTYRLSSLATGHGWPNDRVEVEGWTLDPLECWAAAHLCYPHDPQREQACRTVVSGLNLSVGAGMLFRQANLLERPLDVEPFDIIVCNGLLGGPIINGGEQVRLIVGNLVGLLKEGGVLLAADRFHGGWKKNIPERWLGDAFRNSGLTVVAAGEGIAGFRT